MATKPTMTGGKGVVFIIERMDHHGSAIESVWADRDDAVTKGVPEAFDTMTRFYGDIGQFDADLFASDRGTWNHLGRWVYLREMEIR